MARRETQTSICVPHKRRLSIKHCGELAGLIYVNQSEFLCVRELHCHACRRFSGGDERTKVFPKALNFALPSSSLHQSGYGCALMSPRPRERPNVAEDLETIRLRMMDPIDSNRDPGLMSYGTDGPNSFRQSAVFVNKILQGGKPADMPVEQPTKFEPTINLKTAKALGITIAESFLVRADTVIE